MAALSLSLRTARLARLDPDAVWNAGLFTILAAFVLSRLLLVVINFQTFLRFPALLLAVPSLTAMGLLLTVLATLAWLRIKRLPLLRVLDAWAPCAALTWAFLALGHFAEGSDPGMATSLGIGVKMPAESLALHPVALYAAVGGLVITAGLYRLLVLRKMTPGSVAGVGFVAVGLSQFLLSFVRQPGEPLWDLDSLQWVAVGMLVVGSALVLMHEGLQLKLSGQNAGRKLE
jgi:phosphatidylglycerol:prolipoprotein diacylglycerol transferase